MREDLEASRVALTSAHPSTLTAAHNLGGLLAEMGRLDEAEVLLREALAGFQLALGEGHPDTRNSAALLEALLERRQQQRGAGGGGGKRGTWGGGAAAAVFNCRNSL